MTNAPPARPPRKKYTSIRKGQCADWSRPPMLGLPARAALAEGDQRADPHEQGGADRQQGVHEDVLLRKLRFLRQPVARRLGYEQEERVRAAQEARRVGAVELCVLEAHRLERLDALLRLAHEIVAEAELDR